MKPLSEYLADWVDWDWAQFYFGASLGFWYDTYDYYAATKHVFWTNHSVGVDLMEMLETLVEKGYLEKRTEPDVAYRWKRRHEAQETEADRR